MKGDEEERKKERELRKSESLVGFKTTRRLEVVPSSFGGECKEGTACYTINIWFLLLHREMSQIVQIGISRHYYYYYYYCIVYADGMYTIADIS